MLGWSIIFFGVAATAAYYGFGEVDTTFTGLAQAVFFLFAALFALSVLVGFVTGGERGRPALQGAARTIGLIALLGVVVGGIYAWIDNDWTATRVGRAIDRRAAAASENATAALRRASESAKLFEWSWTQDAHKANAADAEENQSEADSAPESG